MKIDIEWLTDEHDCENCGSSYAEGAIVTFEDGSKVEMIPSAHCFDGESYDSAKVYEVILKHLGYTMVSRHNESTEHEDI